jgi:hypothetical protein
MFSHAERTFLRTLVDGPDASVSARLEHAFPNPAYRRKLMWGIRQKADRSLGDWLLYSAAARRDERLLPATPEAPCTPTPLFADPIVTALEDLKRFWTRKRRSGRPERSSPPR